MGKIKDRPIPPCPDPALYVLITTKEGSYWRVKRGTIKPAPVNEHLKESAARMKLTSPAAKNIITALSHQLKDLETGRIMVRMGALLGKSLKQDGTMSFKFLQGYEFQPYHPLNALVHVAVAPEITDTSVRLHLTMKAGERVLLPEALAETQVRFTVTVVKGNPMAGLRTSSMASPAFPARPEGDTTCTLSVMLPPLEGPWFLCLKVVALEQGAVTQNVAAKGMQVILAGE